MSKDNIHPIPRLALSFDIDGVVAGGTYTPLWDRDVAHYMACPLVDEQATEIINSLALHYDIYFLSSRAFADSNLATRRWLGQKGVRMRDISGVITSLQAPDKCEAVKLLGISYHIDDDPRVVEELGPLQGILFDSPQRAANKRSKFGQRVFTWGEIAKRFMPEWKREEPLDKIVYGNDRCLCNGVGCNSCEPRGPY